MFDEIYEVERDDYKGFVQQLDPEKVTREPIKMPDKGIIGEQYVSNATHEVLCAVIAYEEKPITHYIINMPQPEERLPAKAVRHVVLREKEEVELFLKFISEQVNKEKPDEETV